MLSFPPALASVARCPSCVFLQHPGLTCFSVALIALHCNFWLTYSRLSQWPKKESFLFLTRLSAFQISTQLCGHALPGRWASAPDPMKETRLSQLVREAPFLWWLQCSCEHRDHGEKQGRGLLGRIFFSILKEKKVFSFFSRDVVICIRYEGH